MLRLAGSPQLTAKYKVATPADWTPDDHVIIAGSVSDEAARPHYPGGCTGLKPCLRIVPQPRS